MIRLIIATIVNQEIQQQPLCKFVQNTLYMRVRNVYMLTVQFKILFDQNV